jgi:uncharacterized protein (DUF427 family)
MKAVWNGQIVADSDETVYIEGNQYFPPESIRKEFFTTSDLTTECHWKGTAHYYNLETEGLRADNAAWYYPEPKAGSEDKVKHTYKNYVAFYKNIVEVS